MARTAARASPPTAACVAARSNQLRDFIRKGAPGSGMPAFDLPAAQLDALAALLHSLNAPAAQSDALGDPRPESDSF